MNALNNGCGLVGIAHPLQGFAQQQQVMPSLYFDAARYAAMVRQQQTAVLSPLQRQSVARPRKHVESTDVTTVARKQIAGAVNAVREAQDNG